jgi:hypothetical protein
MQDDNTNAKSWLSPHRIGPNAAQKGAAFKGQDKWKWNVDTAVTRVFVVLFYATNGSFFTLFFRPPS